MLIISPYCHQEVQKRQIQATNTRTAAEAKEASDKCLVFLRKYTETTIVLVQNPGNLQLFLSQIITLTNLTFLLIVVAIDINSCIYPAPITMPKLI